MAKKKLQPITKTTKKHVKLKREASRKIINKFHHLLKARSLVLKKLQTTSKIDNDNYLKILQESPTSYSYYQKQRNIDKSNNAIKNDKENFVSHIFTEISKLSTTSLNNIIQCERHLNILSQIDTSIESQGGLEIYQAASLNGQNKQRGSDSSKKLIEWLKKSKVDSFDKDALEIGSLSSRNLISKWFPSITRIDLNSQEPDKIIEQDFMKRPLPKSDLERFDCISLSLVLNFIPSAEERGDMLLKLSMYFKTQNLEKSAIFPCLFFVLPLPCVTNSKYINKNNLLTLMKDLGYNLLEYYESTKLVYMLYKYNGRSKKVKFAKRELEGVGKRNRNNFSIVIK